MAEAMYLGKPVIATGYSGNLDFMTNDNSCLIDYELIPVEKDQYPFAEGQIWANPDKEQAVHYMQNLLDNRDFGRQLGRRASQYIRSKFSFLALGLRYRGRLEQILQQVEANSVKVK
jgi:glycosyltransferase involved in cell wall biosynthesis